MVRFSDLSRHAVPAGFRPLLIALLVFAGLSSLLAQVYIMNAQKFAFFDYTHLNEIALQHDFPKMQSMAFDIIVGIKANGPKSSLQASLAYTSGFQKEGAYTKTVKLDGLCFNSAFHQHIVKKNGFFLSPGLGVGIRRYQLNLLDKNSTLSLDQILDDNDISVYRFSNFGVYTELELQLDKYFYIGNMEYGIGINAGYRFDLGDWRYESTALVSDSPVRLSGPYFGWEILLGEKREKVRDRLSFGG